MRLVRLKDFIPDKLRAARNLLIETSGGCRGAVTRIGIEYSQDLFQPADEQKLCGDCRGIAALRFAFV